jgi:hypothetical protein
MQQRQLRLGDILDDYCPRERRVTNHAVVAMVGPDVKQTRCTTCDSEHEYKHAKVPRQRRKGDTRAALYSQVAAGAPKRVTHEHPAASTPAAAGVDDVHEDLPSIDEPHFEDDSQAPEQLVAEAVADPVDNDDTPEDNEDPTREEGPVHRPLIRASLPRPEGQAPPARPLPEFTIRQPGGRPNRFRPRHARGPQGSFAGGNRQNGNFAGPPRGMRPGGGRPPMGSKRHHGGGGRKRSK